MGDDLGDGSVYKKVLIFDFLGQRDQYGVECDTEDIEEDHYLGSCHGKEHQIADMCHETGNEGTEIKKEFQPRRYCLIDLGYKLQIFVVLFFVIHKHSTSKKLSVVAYRWIIACSL